MSGDSTGYRVVTRKQVHGAYVVEGRLGGH